MIQNFTPFASELMPCYGPLGQAQTLLVVKATFDFAGHVVAQGQAMPIYRGDEYFKWAGFEHVIRFESDWAQFKPKIDVIINATAYAPGGKAHSSFDAGMRIGTETRVLRISGKRHWQRHLGLIPSISKAEPVLQVPLIYPLAFGGHDPDHAEVFWASNPTGIGFSTGVPKDGSPLPQIEWADDYIESPAHPNSPAGFGCYGRTWLPRRELFGHYTDSELQFKGIATRLPQSFKAQAWNCAHPRLQLHPQSVSAGTPVILLNLTRDERLEFKLPNIQPCLSFSAQGQHATVRPGFDTITIEPDAGHFALTWRHTVDNMPMDKLDAVKVHL